MFIKKDKNQDRRIRHARVRKRISGTPECPRLNVYRSLTNIYAQIIDDTTGTTLVSASSLDKEIAKAVSESNKTEIAVLVGKLVSERASQKQIKNVVFDRGGYIYTGRVKALAESARKNGLEF
ncbi:MAG: 50S ribosomal protein L18 [Clostridia bacterium]